ncbi:MAG: VWA domain-containing protein [Candidatus Woesearchaeota archaeon]
MKNKIIKKGREKNPSNGLKNRKAYYFVIDAILASLLLLIGLLAITQNKSIVTEQPNEYFSQDILQTLSAIKIYELNETNKNNSFVVSEIRSGTINQENSVLEQVGEYWARGEISKAKLLLESLLSQIDIDKNFEIIVSNSQRTIYDVVYNTTESFSDLNSEGYVVASRRMISGIEKGSPLSGYSSSAYLKKISGKKTSSYAYFGGFVGQGNISAIIKFPSDFNSSKLLDAFIKVETPGTFELYINNIKCGNQYSGIPNKVVIWKIINCNSSFVPGNNNISLNFISNFNESYFSGGFIKATYTTGLLIEETNIPGYKRYYFPGIEGFINLYDSFAVQGIITNWTINVSFDSIYNVYMNLGNNTLFSVQGSNTTQSIIIMQNNLELPFQTIPIRLSITNLSNITILNQGQPSDSILITDTSGSMADCSGVYENTQLCTYEYKSRSWWWWWSVAECTYNGSCSNNDCGISPIYSTRNYQVINRSVCLSLLEIAKRADKLFVETILNESLLHRIGLVDFATNANYFPLTNIPENLKSRIDTYVASGSTCTCCGINYARNMLVNSSKKKFIILLSDGEPNYYCDNYNDYTGTNDNTPGDVLSKSWAINASILACQSNITVYTIGFGEAMSQEGKNLMKQLACNESLYYDASNASSLLGIYKNISEQVLLSANFSSQTVTVSGNLVKTKLYPQSYIDVYYRDISNISDVGKLSVKMESEQFNGCNASIYIPQNILVSDAYVTSYSGSHWTKELFVNGNIVFNITNYGTSYVNIGDPFIIQVPSLLLIPGTFNNISLVIGDTPYNNSICSPNNTLIYTALINISIPRSGVLKQSSGCIWNILFEDGTVYSLKIPKDYSGSNNCYYNQTLILYNEDDAYDVSVYNLLKSLDFDNNGLVDVNLNNEDLEIIVTSVDSVPYLWGPSIIEARTWSR